ncbi:hypothetical protein ASG25_20780 [Rhizobium sp. Leaf384]|uniref:DUF6766 family protein n=1 Tax=Rhizobium sp. Leaf384 TaxID=1736358 RepID=UPI000715672D|nr:DUF6766 family protein [Rhizobium sp. Leaf384]KQS75254.1 hypothetical protein ASG25_20780 [Rhizobium sp. Leaf384]
MRILRDNGLTIVLMTLSIFTIIGMFFTGFAVYSEDLATHGAVPLTMAAYAVSGHFLSAVFENWESEFLQMSAYVVLTAFLFQRGSAESKDPDEPAAHDEERSPELGRSERNPPWPVRAGGMAEAFYRYSLGIALAVIFVLSFLLHLGYSAEDASAEAIMHGSPPVSLLQHLGSAQFWFESLQNWQSEFLSTAVLVVLSIFLRFKGSPESKPVSAPHSETGS